MRCVKHKNEAVAVCAHCGRALCPECIAAPNAPRITCGPECAVALGQMERGLETLLRKSIQNARATAFYYYLCALVSAGASVAAYKSLPVPILIWFTAGGAVALFLCGIWHTVLGRKSRV